MKLGHFLSIASVSIVVSVASLSADQAGYYVLDGFGGIHAGGGAPAIAPGTPYFGFDIARDISYVTASTGEGILVLDGFGGVHAGGALASAPPLPASTYFGFDVARAITYRNIPPRLSGNVFNGVADLATASTTLTSIVSTLINVPADGSLLVMGNVQLRCFDIGPGAINGQVSLNVDSTAEDPDFSSHTFSIDCDEPFLNGRSNSPVKVYPVTAGSHTAHLLLRKTGGATNKSLRYEDAHIAVFFIGGNGLMALPAN